MAYQHGTIQSTASGGFSFVPIVGAISPSTIAPMISGSVSCKTGDCWVRLLHTNTIGPGFTPPTASGSNSLVLGPTIPASYSDGWIHLGPGMFINFGTERVADTTFVDPVAQVDVFCTVASEVSILGH